MTELPPWVSCLHFWDAV